MTKKTNHPEDALASVAAFMPSQPMKASPQVTDRVMFRGVEPLNKNELNSVYALLAYVAYNQDVRQEMVQAVVESQFGVKHVMQLKQKDYEEVIRFLVDLRLDELTH